jgi:hypothetical protein
MPAPPGSGGGCSLWPHKYPRQLKQMRRRCKRRAQVKCALRLAHFLQQHNEANLVVLAVRKFKRHVLLLQR